MYSRLPFHLNLIQGLQKPHLAIAPRLTTPCCPHLATFPLSLKFALLNMVVGGFFWFVGLKYISIIYEY
jgi:hypothetical protein